MATILSRGGGGGGEVNMSVSSKRRHAISNHMLYTFRITVIKQNDIRERSGRLSFLCFW